MRSQLTRTTAVSASSQNTRSSTGTERPLSPSVDNGGTCPSCGTKVETVNTSEAVCPDCQVVITAEPVSTAPRPRYDDTDEETARTGSRVTLLYADRGLGTGIDSNARTDSNGSPLTASQRRVCRDEGWTKHLRPREFRLDYALGEIRRMGAQLNVPTSELECAARLYRQALSEGQIRGRSVDGFVAACLLAAIRQSSLTLPVSVREVESASPATRDQFRTARGLLEVRLDVEVPPMNPQDFLPWAASRLSAPHCVELCARRLLAARRADDDATESISPRTLAAAALHAAFSVVTPGERPTLSAIADVMDVSESTVSERKGHLLQYQDASERFVEV